MGVMTMNQWKRFVQRKYLLFTRSETCEKQRTEAVSNKKIIRSNIKVVYYN